MDKHVFIALMQSNIIWVLSATQRKCIAYEKHSKTHKIKIKKP